MTGHESNELDCETFWNPCRALGFLLVSQLPHFGPTDSTLRLL